MARPLTINLHKISDEDFEEIVNSSKSYADILRKCNVSYVGGNLQSIKNRISDLKLDSSHIPIGMNSNKNRTFSVYQLTLEDALQKVFVENSKSNRQYVKKLIKRFDLFPYKCKCGNKGLWNGKPLVLQLEHKNGINNDYRVENLCYLCPNCHSQTTTFSGKNARRNKGKNNPSFGKFWITNETENKFVSKGTLIPSGFKRGLTKYRRI